jgi:hypothetical protein
MHRIDVQQDEGASTFSVLALNQVATHLNLPNLRVGRSWFVSMDIASGHVCNLQHSQAKQTAAGASRAANYISGPPVYL